MSNVLTATPVDTARFCCGVHMSDVESKRNSQGGARCTTSRGTISVFNNLPDFGGGMKIKGRLVTCP